MPAANPQAPLETTRTLNPTVSASIEVCSSRSRATILAAQTLDPEVGVGCTAFPGAVQRHVGEAIERQREKGGINGARCHGTQFVSIRLTLCMDSGELHHLLFRWLHVVSAMVWIGHIWSLVFAQPMRQPPTDVWSRAWAGATWLTGVSLLIVVYYGEAR